MNTLNTLKVNSHTLRHHAVRHNAAKRHDFFHTYSVSRCKRSNRASSRLVTSQVFTLRNMAEDGKYYLFALGKKSLAILMLTRLVKVSDKAW